MTYKVDEKLLEGITSWEIGRFATDCSPSVESISLEELKQNINTKQMQFSMQRCQVQQDVDPQDQFDASTCGSSTILKL